MNTQANDAIKFTVEFIMSAQGHSDRFIAATVKMIQSMWQGEEIHKASHACGKSITSP